ncbi:hypothetical protein DVH05_024675 [Phytophthora capsici]|nr:hypothetical protein DVH05_024675 [Phytophthora capsici]
MRQWRRPLLPPPYNSKYCKKDDVATCGSYAEYVGVTHEYAFKILVGCGRCPCCLLSFGQQAAGDPSSRRGPVVTYTDKEQLADEVNFVDIL